MPEDETGDIAKPAKQPRLNLSPECQNLNGKRLLTLGRTACSRDSAPYSRSTSTRARASIYSRRALVARVTGQSREDKLKQMRTIQRYGTRKEALYDLYQAAECGTRSPVQRSRVGEFHRGKITMNFFWIFFFSFFSATSDLPLAHNTIPQLVRQHRGNVVKCRKRKPTYPRLCRPDITEASIGRQTVP